MQCISSRTNSWRLQSEASSRVESACTARVSASRVCWTPTAATATIKLISGTRKASPCSCRYWKNQRNAGRSFMCSAQATTDSSRQEAVRDLLAAIEGTERGLTMTKEQKRDILATVSNMQQLGKGSKTTKGPINATWKLVWTTEKETLFILKNARWFGTEASSVYQVIDVPSNRLQNVITFQNGASFVVDSSLEEAGEQRLVFRFTSARLNLKTRTFKLPPFGKGWFDTIYLDNDIRVAKDIRGDTLVVKRDGPPRAF